MTPIDIVKRGFSNTLANWQLLLVRIALGVVMLFIVVGAVVAVVVPMAISAGFTKFDPRNADAAAVMLSLLTDHWLLVLYILVVASVVLAAACLVYSFAQSGSARIYSDGEDAAGAADAPPRERFAVFDPQRWFQGAIAGTWRVFWIYNIAWTITLALILVPLVFVPAIIYIGGVMAIVAGCGLMLLIGAASIVLFILAGAVMCKATARAVRGDNGAAESLRSAVADFRADFSRNFTVAFIIMVVHLGGAALLTIVSVAGSFGQRMPGISMVFVPTQIISSLLQTVFSAFTGSWALASFVAIDAERNRVAPAPAELRHQPSVVSEVIRIDRV